MLPDASFNGSQQYRAVGEEYNGAASSRINGDDDAVNPN
jgi:hypothetical protein